MSYKNRRPSSGVSDEALAARNSNKQRRKQRYLIKDDQIAQGRPIFLRDLIYRFRK